MLEGLLLSLLNTFASYLFEQHLRSTYDVELAGAPAWYYYEEPSQFCSFNYLDGDYQRLERAKRDNREAMARRINDLTDETVYKAMPQVRSPEERAQIEAFKHDPQLANFIKAEVDYVKIEYKETVNRIFVKGCIDKVTIEAYQKLRLQQIGKKLTHFRADRAFDELQGGAESDAAFKELEASGGLD